MSSTFDYILLATYITVAAGLMIYGMNCYWVLVLFNRRYRQAAKRNLELIRRYRRELSDDDLPMVTTQIPLYNEYNVAERVIRAVAAIDYPAGKHEIQVLDDSTDESRDLIDRVAAELQAEGKDIHVIRRTNRTGFKAGALKYGMAICKGEYIAIFDSDFVPPADYLRKSVPFLIDDPTIGLVQARWGHLNRHESLLTYSQAIGIDGHFVIEQSARSYNAHFMNFNGTAGLWRKQAIEDGGGWEADTLTEDMDLSYRVQLAGWRLYFVPQIVVPAELPNTFTAFKSQQFRWAKGSIQTALKIYPRVLASKARLTSKIQAFFHLTHYCIHPLMALMALLGLPLLLHVQANLTTVAAFAAGMLIFLATLGPNTLYCFSQYAVHKKDWGKRILFLPVLMSLGVGICLSNSRAVFEGLTGIKSGFIRTPKAGADDAKRKTYRLPKSPLPFAEVIFGLYCVWTALMYYWADNPLVIPFMLLYAAGFLYVGFNGLREPLMARG